ncbi:hypothetical protein GQ54DRAFT_144362 [Martensiomyces pterosporus]|nr:hypothetical protein GQ54DRAFT_144362 [Martensiomyces pterosporus]
MRQAGRGLTAASILFGTQQCSLHIFQLARLGLISDKGSLVLQAITGRECALSNACSLCLIVPASLKYPLPCPAALFRLLPLSTASPTHSQELLLSLPSWLRHRETCARLTLVLTARFC